MSNNINMPVKPCEDASGNQYSPVVYAHSLFNNDGTPMRPVPSKTIAKAYDATQTYPTYSPYCIYQNTFYKFTGTGTTTGAFDDTKWTETDAAEEFTTLNNTLTYLQQQTDVTSAFIVGSTGYSRVYRNSKNICGMLVISGVTIGDYKQLDSSLIPKADRAAFPCYNFSTGAPMTNLSVWILSTGILTFYGTAPASTTQVAIPINYMTV